MKTEHEIRLEHKLLREGLKKEELQAASFDIKNVLCRDLLIEKPSAVLAFYPLGNEINLFSYYELLLKEGYSLFFPVAKNQVLTFYQITSMKDFALGAWNIMEPIEQVVSYHEKAYEITYALIPGLAFGQQGERIGYGAGYYDKFLQDHSLIKKIGVCYSFQLLDQLPQQPWDIPMDYIYTPQGGILCR